MNAGKMCLGRRAYKNPDTDSICAALAYAEFENQHGGRSVYVAKTRGARSSEETRYVLERFGAKEPGARSRMRARRSRILTIRRDQRRVQRSCP